MTKGMDRFWSESEQAFKREVAEFAKESLAKDLPGRDRTGTFSREDWNRCAEFGILGLCVPEEYGGGGADIVRGVVAMEGLGLGCPDNGLTMALNAQMWTVQHTILNFGTEEQKRRLLPPLCRGELIGAQAMTESEAGSDVYSLKTTAEPRDGSYVLNGRKIMVTLAPIADLAVVYATVDASRGQWGVTAFLVELDSPGCHVEPTDEKMGLRTVPLGALAFEDCLAADDGRIGPEGSGLAIASDSLAWERSCMLASHVGMMERELLSAVRFARQRRQFGQTIGKFQSVSNRIADMKVRLEAARLLVYRVAALRMNGHSAHLEAAAAKLFVAESALESGLDTVRIHGGRGYLTETGCERDLRDSIGTVLWGGTSDIQRLTIARLLGL